MGNEKSTQKRKAYKYVDYFGGKNYYEQALKMN